jgi:hypothetical protein
MQEKPLIKFPCSWIDRIIVLENSYTTKSNLYGKWNPYQNFNDILQQDIQVHPKVQIEHRRPQIPRAILNKKSNAGGVTIPDHSIVLKTMLYWHKNRQEDQ